MHGTRRLSPSVSPSVLPSARNICRDGGWCLSPIILYSILPTILYPQTPNPTSTATCTALNQVYDGVLAYSYAKRGQVSV